MKNLRQKIFRLKLIDSLQGNLNYILLAGVLICSCDRNVVTINDISGLMGATESPVYFRLKLDKEQLEAYGSEGLVLHDLSTGETIPFQMENTSDDINSVAVAFLPHGHPGPQKLKLIKTGLTFNEAMTGRCDPDNNQVLIEENGKIVLQYNYNTVYEKDVIRNIDEGEFNTEVSVLTGIYLEDYLKSHSGTGKETRVTTSIYAVPRSDYIHPLYGLDDEMLTRDWPDNDHPHHRGIFWAWPEVEYGSCRGDIYALQRIFARPTGKIEYSGGPVFAQIAAENYWMWEDTEPIVCEESVIRVYRSSTEARIIDLAIKLDALKDSISIATRSTNSYGGLNLRMQTPDSMDICYVTNKPGSEPLRSWSDLSGIFRGTGSVSGLMVLQHQGNPEYPGTWVEYPNLAWVQPTFPAQNTRYRLIPGKPLVLRYRLIVHTGRRAGDEISEKCWDAFNNELTPIIEFDHSTN